jgi:hypothetical protein
MKPNAVKLSDKNYKNVCKTKMKFRMLFYSIGISDLLDEF